MRRLMPLLLLSPLSLCAEESFHQHEAHVHGAAQLQIVAEGEQLIVSLFGAAYSFYGFEHTPETEKQKKRVTEVEHQFKTGADLFTFNGASCQLSDASLELPFGGHTDEHEDHEHHENDEHHDSDEHHEGHDHGGTHSNINVEYQFTCEGLRQLSGVEVNLFKPFTELQHLQVEAIINNKPIFAELDGNKNKLVW